MPKDLGKKFKILEKKNVLMGNKQAIEKAESDTSDAVEHNMVEVECGVIME